MLQSLSMKRLFRPTAVFLCLGFLFVAAPLAVFADSDEAKKDVRGPEEKLEEEEAPLVQQLNLHSLHKLSGNKFYLFPLILFLCKGEEESFLTFRYIF